MTADSDTCILILGGMIIMLICIIILILILAVKRDYIRRYRILATLFSMLGNAGMLLLILGLMQTFVSYL